MLESCTEFGGTGGRCLASCEEMMLLSFTTADALSISLRARTISIFVRCGGGISWWNKGGLGRCRSGRVSDRARNKLP